MINLRHLFSQEVYIYHILQKVANEYVTETESEALVLKLKITNGYLNEKTRWNVKIKRLSPPKSTRLDPRLSSIYTTGRVNSTKAASRQTGTFCNNALIIKLNDLDIPDTQFTKENRCPINFAITF